jgi:hypothetical protein
LCLRRSTKRHEFGDDPISDDCDRFTFFVLQNLYIEPMLILQLYICVLVDFMFSHPILVSFIFPFF